MFLSVEGHELDESHDPTGITRERCEVQDLIVVLSPQNTTFNLTVGVPRIQLRPWLRAPSRGRPVAESQLNRSGRSESQLMLTLRSPASISYRTMASATLRSW